MLVSSTCVCVLHYIRSADNIIARIFSTLQSSTTCCLTLLPFFLCNPCSSMFFIPQHVVFHLPHLLNTPPLLSRSPVSAAPRPLSSIIVSTCVVLLPPQRVAKTPSAARAAPACPASTGIPKRRSPHCSLESPTVARVTPCPRLVCGWAPA